MVRRILCFIAFLPVFWANAQDRTLRVDYIFSGTDKTADIALDELRCIDGWAGRSVNVREVPVKGNGDITMRDAVSGDTLYRMSFSTLFHEWQTTEEATRISRSFEGVYLLPMPYAPVDITVTLFDFRGREAASLTHRVDPAEILIRPAGKKVPDHRYLLRNGKPDECIDIAIVAEGYTAEEMETFYNDAARAYGAIVAHQPFGSLRECFNIVAVGLESPESGVSIPGKGIWKETALHSQFDTFHMDRYLTTLHLKDLHDALAGIPYEHIIILANTDNYGGGGIYNNYTLTTTHNPYFWQVVVHEFGHSFGALADEYYYDDMFSPYYFPDMEPWEKNLTTKVDFSSKWEPMVGKVEGVSLYEGGGYVSKGVWRSFEDCRMKTNSCETFCPVCRKAIEDMIMFHTRERGR